MILLPPPPPARVQVVAKEFSFALSRPWIRAGAAILELSNFGEDPHDLRLQRVGGTKVYGLAARRPGTRGELEVRLRPGTYRLWCSIADHRARGMRATLVVRRPA